MGGGDGPDDRRGDHHQYCDDEPEGQQGTDRSLQAVDAGEATEVGKHVHRRSGPLCDGDAEVVVVAAGEAGGVAYAVAVGGALAF